MQNCNNCFYWDKKDHVDAGRCCSNVPAVTLVPTQGVAGQGLSVITYWPETKGSDRCGKWRAIYNPSTNLQAN